MRLWMVCALTSCLSCLSPSPVSAFSHASSTRRLRHDALILDNSLSSEDEHTEQQSNAKAVRLNGDTGEESIQKTTHKNRFHQRFIEPSSSSKFTRHQLRPPGNDSPSAFEPHHSRTPKQISRRVLPLRPVNTTTSSHPHRRSLLSRPSNHRISNDNIPALTFHSPGFQTSNSNRPVRRRIRQIAQQSRSPQRPNPNSSLIPPDQHRINTRQVITSNNNNRGSRQFPPVIIQRTNNNSLRQGVVLGNGRSAISINFTSRSKGGHHRLHHVLPLQNFVRFRARTPGISRRLPTTPSPTVQLETNSIIEFPSLGVESFHRTFFIQNETSFSGSRAPSRRPIELLSTTMVLNKRGKIRRPFIESVKIKKPSSRLLPSDAPDNFVNILSKDEQLPPVLPAEFERVSGSRNRGNVLQGNAARQPTDNNNNLLTNQHSTKLTDNRLHHHHRKGNRLKGVLKSSDLIVHSSDDLTSDMSEEDIERAVIQAVIDSSTTTELPSSSLVVDSPSVSLPTSTARPAHRSRQPPPLPLQQPPTPSSTFSFRAPASRHHHHRIRKPRPLRPPVFTPFNFKGAASSIERIEAIIVEDAEAAALGLHKGFSKSPRKSSEVGNDRNRKRIKPIKSSQLSINTTLPEIRNSIAEEKRITVPLPPEVTSSSTSSSTHRAKISSFESEENNSRRVVDDTDIDRLHMEIENNILEALNSPFGPPRPLSVASSAESHSDGPPGAQPPSDQIVTALNRAEDFMEVARQLHLFRSRVHQRRRRRQAAMRYLI